MYLLKLLPPRKPEYRSLTPRQKQAIPPEKNKQIYLSSIRGAEEWSYKEFEQYVDYMTKGDTSYMTIALPYNLGVKNGYISRDIVEQSFKENQESVEMLLAEYCCVPEKGLSNSFYKYNSIDRCRTVSL